MRLSHGGFWLAAAADWLRRCSESELRFQCVRTQALQPQAQTWWVELINRRVASFRGSCCGAVGDKKERCFEPLLTCLHPLQLCDASLATPSSSCSDGAANRANAVSSVSFSLCLVRVNRGADQGWVSVCFYCTLLQVSSSAVCPGSCQVTQLWADRLSSDKLFNLNMSLWEVHYVCLVNLYW